MSRNAFVQFFTSRSSRPLSERTYDQLIREREMVLKEIHSNQVFVRGRLVPIDGECAKAIKALRTDLRRIDREIRSRG